ncbi:MAG: antiterminator Q family protein [Pseudomonadota bacterium]|nr:antiterminator Q family protein [Pseudomonadota bacterium]
MNIETSREEAKEVLTNWGLWCRDHKSNLGYPKVEAMYSQVAKHNTKAYFMTDEEAADVEDILCHVMLESERKVLAAYYRCGWTARDKSKHNLSYHTFSTMLSAAEATFALLWSYRNKIPVVGVAMPED